MFKILIRPLEKKDAQISWRWRNDPDIWEFTGSKPGKTITPEIELKWIEEKLSESNSRRFAITVDDIYVGNIQLTNITKCDAEYHIFIGEKSFWGKGIAFSATQQIIRVAKNILQLENIYLKVNPENIKAINLYEKSGFKVVSDEMKMVLSLANSLRPMVSVFCMVYNHENYLRECLDGFLTQKCNFDFEIVVGEDNSKDNSRSILLEYAKKYPGKFKLLLNEKNIGAVQNQILVFENCTGKYIAMCEGDDYWTEPNKLQKQVEFLEQKHEFIACFHNARVINSINGQTYNHHDWEFEREVPLMELLKLGGYSFPTASLTFRNYGQFSASFKHSAGDMEILLALVIGGKFYFSPEIMAVYRRHCNGVYSGLKQNQKEFIRSELLIIGSLEEKKKELNPEIWEGVKEHIKLKLRKLLLSSGFKKILFLKGIKYLNFLTTIKLIIVHEKNHRH